MDTSSEKRTYTIEEIGRAKNDYSEEVPEDYDERISVIEVFEEHLEALKGIEENSHVVIFFWLHESDRSVKQVYPMGDESNPLTGVFATRAPVRPNPIGSTVCRLEKREGDELYVKGLDALDDTPVIDIKPYTSKFKIEEPEFPDWVPRRDESE